MLFRMGRAMTACILATVFATPGNLLAQVHVVSRPDLQRAMIAAAQARKQNLDTASQFLSSQMAQKLVRSAHMDPGQVRIAVSTLSDEELVELAAKAKKAHADFSAGRLSDRDLVLIILGMVALVVIIVAVQHHHHD